MDPTCKKKSSTQIDMICFDRFKYPVLLDSNEFVVVPAKAVKGMIEIKSTLTKNSIDQVLNLTNSDVLREVSGSSKISLLSTKSSIKAEYAYRYIKKYYETEPKINKFLGAIYSLDWDVLLSFRATQSNRKISYSGSILEIRENDIAPFISSFLFDVYGNRVYSSIANSLAPSIFKVKESFSIELFTNVDNFFV